MDTYAKQNFLGGSPLLVVLWANPTVLPTLLGPVDQDEVVAGFFSLFVSEL